MPGLPLPIQMLPAELFAEALAGLVLRLELAHRGVALVEVARD